MSRLTICDVQYIIDNFKHMEGKDISKQLRHSTWAIYATAHELGMYKKPNEKYRKRFTPEARAMLSKECSTC